MSSPIHSWIWRLVFIVATGTSYAQPDEKDMPSPLVNIHDNIFPNITRNSTHLNSPSGSGVDLKQCFDSGISWDLAYTEWAKAHAPLMYITSDATYGLPITLGVGQTYTECDGIPRVRAGFKPTATTFSNVSWSFVYSEPDMNSMDEVSPFPVPTPECAIPESHCPELWSSYMAPRTEGNELLAMGGKFNLRAYPRNVKCPFGLAFPRCDGCEVSAKQIALIYWPPALTSRDICARDGAGIASTLSITGGQTVITTDAITLKSSIPDMDESKDPTTITHVITGNFTFTSPSMYLAYQSMYAGCSLEAVHPDGVISLKSDDILTVVPQWDSFNGSGVELAQLMAKGVFAVSHQLERLTTSSLNLADLQDPVPASLWYNGAMECWGLMGRVKLCPTIMDDTYRPFIVLKRNVLSSIDPMWSKCNNGALGQWDPPILLSRGAIQQLPTPIFINSATQTPLPGSSPTLPWPSPTAQSGEGLGSLRPSPDPPNQPQGMNRPPAVVMDPGIDTPNIRPGALMTDADGLVRWDKSAAVTPGHALNVGKSGIAIRESNADSFPNPTHVFQIGQRPVTAVFGSNRLEHVNFGGITLQNGQSATIDGKVVAVVSDHVLVDGSMVMSADTRNAAGEEESTALLDPGGDESKRPASSSIRRHKNTGLMIGLNLSVSMVAVLTFILGLL